MRLFEACSGALLPGVRVSIMKPLRIDVSVEIVDEKRSAQIRNGIYRLLSMHGAPSRVIWRLILVCYMVAITKFES